MYLNEFFKRLHRKKNMENVLINIGSLLYENI